MVAPRDALNKSSGQALLADRDGLQGANRSHSPRSREDLQRGRPPESAGSAARALVQSIPSLKARAVAALSRREYSRAQLAKKLAQHTESGAESDAALQALLDELERAGWQSDARYAEGWVHRKAARHGAARIVHDLRQQGVEAEQLANIQDELRATEPARARAVWAKRFDAPPQDARQYARQARFLAARGFSHDVVRKVLDTAGDAWGQDE